MSDRTTKRLRSEGGFTLIELLMVLIIIGILLMIAVPSYLGFKDRANKAAAQANIRAAIPSIEAFFADHSSYAGMGSATTTTLSDYDAGVKVNVDAAQTNATTYCVYWNQGGVEFFKLGPAGAIVADATPGATPCA